MVRSEASPRVRIFRSPWTMVGAALVLRLIVMCFTYQIQLDPSKDHWAFGWETGKVARSIVTGDGFSLSILRTNPGPPRYAAAAADSSLCIHIWSRLFLNCSGIPYTASSALVLLTLNNLFSSLTCLPIYFIARRVFGPGVATSSGWAWVIFQYSIALSNTVIWETLLTTMLFSTAVWATLYLGEIQPLHRLGRLRIVVGSYGPRGPCNAFRPAVSRRLDLGSTLATREIMLLVQAFASALVFFAVVTPWIWHAVARPTEDLSRSEVASV